MLFCALVRTAAAFPYCAAAKPAAAGQRRATLRQRAQPGSPASARLSRSGPRAWPGRSSLSAWMRSRTYSVTCALRPNQGSSSVKGPGPLAAAPGWPCLVADLHAHHSLLRERLSQPDLRRGGRGSGQQSQKCRTAADRQGQQDRRAAPRRQPSEAAAHVREHHGRIAVAVLIRQIASQTIGSQRRAGQHTTGPRARATRRAENRAAQSKSVGLAGLRSWARRLWSSALLPGQERRKTGSRVRGPHVS